MEINRTELDFFKCQVLQNKTCTFVVRDGKIYFYAESNKYIIDDSTPEDKINFPVDTTINGFLHFWTKDGFYGLAFIDANRKRDPIVIKCGNLIDETA